MLRHYDRQDNIFEHFKPLSRQEMMMLDEQYTIVKDYGWGHHLLGINSFIDSASTPNAITYMKNKKPFFTSSTGPCVDKLDSAKKVRTFDILSKNITCVDNDSSITRGDREIEHSITPKTNKNLNIFLLNLIWKLNLYYCTKCIYIRDSDCTSEVNHIVYHFLYNVIFVDIIQKRGSLIPKMVVGENNIPQDTNKMYNEIKNYIKIDNLYTPGSTVQAVQAVQSLTKPKTMSPIIFFISQSSVARKMLALMRKHTIGNIDHVRARNPSKNIENIENIDNTVTTLTHIFMNKSSIPDEKVRAQACIFMLRILKFMGDRSHIIVAKIV